VKSNSFRIESVFEDIDLGRFQDLDAAHLCVHAVDLVELPGEALGVHAVGDSDMLGVVANGEIVIAAVFGRARHFLDRILAVGGGGVDMEIAADVIDGNEMGQLVR